MEDTPEWKRRRELEDTELRPAYFDAVGPLRNFVRYCPQLRLLHEEVLKQVPKKVLYLTDEEVSK